MKKTLPILQTIVVTAIINVAIVQHFFKISREGALANLRKMSLLVVVVHLVVARLVVAHLMIQKNKVNVSLAGDNKPLCYCLLNL